MGYISDIIIVRHFGLGYEIIYIFFLFKINDGDDDDVHCNCADDQNVMKFPFFIFFITLNGLY